MDFLLHGNIGHLPDNRCHINAAAVVLLAAFRADAQQTPLLPTPVTPIPYTPRCVPNDNGGDCAYFNFFAGPAFAAGNGLQPTRTVGVTLGQYFTKSTGKGRIASPQFELGLVGPLPGGHHVDGLASLEFMFSGKLLRQPRFLFAMAGYTRLFVTGNAVTLGVGIDLGKPGSNSVHRIEPRDYFLFTGPQQHVISLRFAFGSLIDD